MRGTGRAATGRSLRPPAATPISGSSAILAWSCASPLAPIPSCGTLR